MSQDAINGHLLNRAQEYRVLAEVAGTNQARASYLTLAESYELLAEVLCNPGYGRLLHNSI